MKVGSASLACCVFLALASTTAAFQATTRVSVATSGVQGNGDSGIFGLSISADGRYVAFQSDATNLVGGDTNAWRDVFVRDRQGGATERVSVATGGAQANGDSQFYGPSISADGRYIAFGNNATNLVGGDTNGAYDIFVRDRQNGTTERVSVATGGVQASGGSDCPSISADGRLVAFYSLASNLVAGDTNAAFDVFVHDLQSGTTERVSMGAGGAQGDSSSYTPSISANGRYVAFMSDASNLIGGDTNGAIDIFVRDRQTSTTERVSVGAGGVQGNDNSLMFFGASISADGRFVAFGSVATNLVGGDTNGIQDLFVRDRVGGTTERVSVATSGTQANGVSGFNELSISGDGRYVAFESDATNLVSVNSGGPAHIFVRDRQSATTEQVSVDSSGAQGNSSSYLSSISADGRFVAFESFANNLVGGDSNNAYDVFVRDRGLLYPGKYCTAGTTTHGCLALIACSGTPSTSSGSGFTINVSAVEGQKQGILFYGLNNNGFAATMWGVSSSYLCVKPPTQRTPAQSSGGTSNNCNGALSLDWNTFVSSNPNALGAPFAIGQHVFAQAWFRDPPSPKTTMLSNGLEFVVGP